MPKVVIEDDPIFLGKIAQINGDDTQLVQKLKHIVIARAPLPAKSRLLDQRYLKLRLKQNAIDLSALNLQMPSRIEISRSYVEINKEEIKQFISDFIHQNIPQRKRSIRIKNIRVPESIILPKGRITYKVAVPRNTNWRGKSPLAIHFEVNGQLQKKVWVSATIEVLAQVVVTQKPLGRYKTITEDDIYMQSMDLANLPSNVITDPEAVLGKRTRRAIGAQTALRTDLIELPPLVKRGDMVLIVAESEGLKITALGQVKKKGRFDERIPVMNLDSKKILYAKVVDSNTVKVEF